MPDLRQLLPTDEFRFAARRIRSAPSFAAACVLVLAIGVGAATAAFSLIDGIVLEPLPYEDSNRLVRLTHTVSNVGPLAADQSDASVMVYQNRARAFDGVAAWRFDDGDLGPSEDGQNAIRVRGSRVTANFFDVLRVRPALGRGFAPGEDRPGAARVAVLSHRIWQERFHGDAAAIGRQVVVNNVPRTIVGVMAPGFAYPTSHVELWLPLTLDATRTQPATFNLVGIGRLARGVTTQAARADLARVLPHMRDYFHGDVSAATWEQAHVAPQVQLLRDSIAGPVSRVLWLLFGSVLLVLGVACTNVAGLFLVRAERMQVELAVRGALGSGLSGMIALVLSESLLLSAIGGGVGILLAALTIALARNAGGVLSLPRLEAVGISSPVMLFALGMTAFCAIGVSVLPLLRARRVAIAQVLRGAGIGAMGRTRQRARDALVIAQIALAFVLVASSGLMTRSFLRLSDVRPGFDTDHVVTSRVLLPFARYGTAALRLNFFGTLVQRVRAIPGARAVATTDWVPLSGDHHDMVIAVENDPSRASHAVVVVDEKYFQTLRIPIFRGRTFGAPDPTHPSEEVIVSHAFAAQYWPGASPLGKRIAPLGGRWYTIVGEVSDVHYDALDKPANDVVYFPLVAAQRHGGASLLSALSLVVRTDGRDAETLSAIRGIVHSLDSAVPTYNEGSLRELVRDASSRARALAVLLAAASIVTSLLAAIGLYGILAYGVSIRRRELAVRIALGARPAEVSGMVSTNGLRLAGVGIAIGLACTLATSHLLRGLLYGVSPTDLMTLSATPTALLLVALVATWLPAHRAAAVHPAEALRSQ